MAGYLIGEEGALSGLIISLNDGDEWIIGRDPDVCYQVLEDPMVSRKHVIIQKQGDHFLIENLSATNPALVNGEPLIESYELSENDAVKIGSTTFKFTSKPIEDAPSPVERDLLPFTESDEMDLLSFKSPIQTRWMLKVTMGPNTGAEFGLEDGKSYTIGKDPKSSDIVFQDLSVSRSHAKLTVTLEGELFIDDLRSRNGVLVNGSLIEQRTQLNSQDAVAIGTTTFVAIDRVQERETIYSPSLYAHETSGLSEKDKEALIEKELAHQEQQAIKKNWKETFIPTRHIALGGLLFLIIFSATVGIISLFHAEPVMIAQRDEDKEIKQALKNFKAVTFNFDGESGSLFLIGHVLTDVDYQQMLYMLKTLPFIYKIDDNVIIDELIWKNMNALLFKNPEWRSVLVAGSEPGKFVLKGYIQSPDQQVALSDYINVNFPYLDKLENQVVVEDNLNTKIQSLLVQKGFMNVTFQLINGEIIFSGRLDDAAQKEFNHFLKDVDNITGVRQIRNFVIVSHESSTRVDLSNRFTVTGSSKLGNLNQFILINGKIVGTGDQLDGMHITAINPTSVFLEKDGMKYKIDYNLQ